MIGSALVVRPIAGPVIGAASRDLSVDQLLAAFFRGRSPHTMRAYQLDLEDFAKFLRRWLSLPLGLAAREALRAFLQQGGGSANEIVIHYLGDLDVRGLASGTINRRLAALRSIVKFGRMIGMVGWSLEVPGRATERVRETRGPDVSTAARLLDSLAVLTDARGRRDYAMIRLMLDVGLRVSEVVALDVGDLDFSRSSARVLGKGRRAKQTIDLPQSTCEALAAWLAVKSGATDGPVFTRSKAGSRGPEGGRLLTRSAYRQVRFRGREIGIRLWPHALRHTAITIAVEQARQHDIGLDEVRQFSRHKHIQTLLVYRDETRNVQRQLAALVSSHLDGAK